MEKKTYIKIRLFNRTEWFAGYDKDGTILKGNKEDRVVATEKDISKVRAVLSDVKTGGFHVMEVIEE